MNKCMICHYETETGIVIQQHTICLACEQVMVAIDVDHPFYPLFMDRLKAMKVE